MMLHSGPPDWEIAGCEEPPKREGTRTLLEICNLKSPGRLEVPDILAGGCGKLKNMDKVHILIYITNHNIYFLQSETTFTDAYLSIAEKIADFSTGSCAQMLSAITARDKPVLAQRIVKVGMLMEERSIEVNYEKERAKDMVDFAEETEQKGSSQAATIVLMKMIRNAEMTEHTVS